MATRKALRHIGTDNIVRYDERYANNGKFEVIELDDASEVVEVVAKEPEQEPELAVESEEAVGKESEEANIDDLIAGLD